MSVLRDIVIAYSNTRNQITFMKRILLVLAIILGLGIVFFGTKNPLLNSLFTAKIKKVTGLNASIEKFSIGTLKRNIKIKGLSLNNSRQFPEKQFFNFLQLTADYELSSLLKRKPHLYKANIELKEIIVIKTRDGKINLEQLQFAPKEGSSQLTALEIDTLSLNIGKVFYKDYSRADKPVIDVYEINLKDKVYKNIKNAEELFALILFESFKTTNINASAIKNASDFLGESFFLTRLGTIFSSKNTVEEYFDASYEHAYKVSSDIIYKEAKTIKEDKVNGVIQAKKDDGVSITLKIVKIDDRTVKISVSAKVLFIAKPEVAGGILYQISSKLKK